MSICIQRAGEGFEERDIDALRERWELFTHCLAVYELLKVVK